MVVKVELVNDPALLDILIAAGTVGAAAAAAYAAAYAAWIANRQNKRITGRKLHFQCSRVDVTGPSSASITLIVTNDSFRPITLKYVAFRYANGDIIMSTPDASGPPLPVTLQDGEAAEWVFNANDLLAPLYQSRAIMQMFALDTRGTDYAQWVSREPLKRIPMRLRQMRDQRRLVKVWRRELKRLHQEREAQQR